MPFYDYYCSENNKTVEVHHGINERLKTWGEVCKRAGIPLGKTKDNVSVARLIGNAMVLEKKPSSKACESECGTSEGNCAQRGCPYRG